MPSQIPDQMRRNGREPDPVFSPYEDLYIRFDKMSGHHVNPAGISAKNQSVNRSKYSQPKWVLLACYPSYLEWGYGSFLVKNIPDNLITPGGVRIDFKVEHEPEEENYSHSVICPYKEGARYKQIKNKHEVKLKFRVKLSQRIKILKEPNILPPQQNP